MNTGVSSTLVNSLFRSRRQIDAAEYAAAKRRLFPEAELFEQFLVSDEQVRRELAKRILLRLCFDSPFSPPTRLIFHLLRHQEEKTTQPSDTEYAEQDHFIHLVNLYVLGIYFFAFHKGLRDRCTAEMNRIRRNCITTIPNAGDADPAPQGYELFGKLWTYFVLSHDLGYPLEAMAPNASGVTQQAVIKPYTKIGSYLINDLSLKAIAKLVALYETFCDEPEERVLGTYYNLEGSALRKSSAHEQISANKLVLVEVESLKSEIGEMPNASFAIHIQSGEDILAVRTVFNDSKICAVLEDTTTGDAKTLVFGDRHTENPGQCLYLERNISGAKFVSQKIEADLWNQAFVTGRAPKGSVWRYFVLDPANSLKATTSSLLGDVKYKEFLKLHAAVVKDSAFLRKRVSGTASIIDLAAHTYFVLNESLGYVPDELSDDPIQSARRQHSHAVNSRLAVITAFPEIVAACVQKLVAISARGELEGKISNANSLDELAELAAKFISSKEVKTKLADELRVDLGKKFETQFEIGFNLRGLFSATKSLLQNMNRATPDQGELWRAALDESKRPTLAQALDTSVFYDSWLAPESGKGGILAWPNLLPDTKWLLSSYKPGWFGNLHNSKPAPFFDHGMVGSAIFLSAMRFVRGIIFDSDGKGAFDPDFQDKGRTIVQIALGLTSTRSLPTLAIESVVAAKEVGRAIFLHNLYPSEFKDSHTKAYRTSSTSDPFCFLAILADSLQKWDRNLLEPQSYKKMLKTPWSGRDFDLRIQGDRIEIVLKGQSGGFKQLEDGLRTHLKHFLRNAEPMIKLTLSE